MSKTETAKRLAQSASEPLKQVVQSQSERQQQAGRIVEQMDQESQNHSHYLTETVTRMVDDLGMIVDSAKVVINDMESQTQQSVKEQKSAAIKLTKASEAAHQSAQHLNTQLNRMRWTTLLIACAASAGIGMLLLIMWLIMQPGWLQKLWQISQSLT